MYHHTHPPTCGERLLPASRLFTNRNTGALHAGAGEPHASFPRFAMRNACAGHIVACSVLRRGYIVTPHDGSVGDSGCPGPWARRPAARTLLGTPLVHAPRTAAAPPSRRSLRVRRASRRHQRAEEHTSE